METPKFVNIFADQSEIRAPPTPKGEINAADGGNWAGANSLTPKPSLGSNSSGMSEESPSGASATSTASKPTIIPENSGARFSFDQPKPRDRVDEIDFEVEDADSKLEPQESSEADSKSSLKNIRVKVDNPRFKEPKNSPKVSDQKETNKGKQQPKSAGKTGGQQPPQTTGAVVKPSNHDGKKKKKTEKRKENAPKNTTKEALEIKKREDELEKKIKEDLKKEKEVPDHPIVAELVGLGVGFKGMTWRDSHIKHGTINEALSKAVFTKERSISVSNLKVVEYLDHFEIKPPSSEAFYIFKAIRCGDHYHSKGRIFTANTKGQLLMNLQAVYCPETIDYDPEYNVAVEYYMDCMKDLTLHPNNYLNRILLEPEFKFLQFRPSDKKKLAEVISNYLEDKARDGVDYSPMDLHNLKNKCKITTPETYCSALEASFTHCENERDECVLPRPREYHQMRVLTFKCPKVDVSECPNCSVCDVHTGIPPLSWKFIFGFILTIVLCFYWCYTGNPLWPVEMVYNVVYVVVICPVEFFWTHGFTIIRELSYILYEIFKYFLKLPFRMLFGFVAGLWSSLPQFEELPTYSELRYWTLSSLGNIFRWFVRGIIEYAELMTRDYQVSYALWNALSNSDIKQWIFGIGLSGVLIKLLRMWRNRNRGYGGKFKLASLSMRNRVRVDLPAPFGDCGLAVLEVISTCAGFENVPFRRDELASLLKDRRLIYDGCPLEIKHFMTLSKMFGFSLSDYNRLTGIYTPMIKGEGPIVVFEWNPWFTFSEPNHWTVLVEKSAQSSSRILKQDFCVGTIKEVAPNDLLAKNIRKDTCVSKCSPGWGTLQLRSEVHTPYVFRSCVHNVKDSMNKRLFVTEENNVMPKYLKATARRIRNKIKEHLGSKISEISMESVKTEWLKTQKAALREQFRTELEDPLPKTYSPITKMFVKREKTLLAEGKDHKPRIITNPVDMQTSIGPYTYKFSKDFERAGKISFGNSDIYFTSGYNGSRLGELVYNTLKSHKPGHRWVAIEGDFSSFEAKIGKDYQKYEAEIIGDHFIKDLNPIFKSTWKTNLLFEKKNEKFEVLVANKRRSGDAQTLLGNNLVNLLLIRSLFELNSWDEFRSLVLIQGDDNLIYLEIPLEDKVDVEKCIDQLNRCGFILTPVYHEDPYQASYCSGFFYPTQGPYGNTLTYASDVRKLCISMSFVTHRMNQPYRIPDWKATYYHSMKDKAFLPPIQRILKEYEPYKNFKNLQPEMGAYRYAVKDTPNVSEDPYISNYLAKLGYIGNDLSSCYSSSYRMTQI